VQSLIVAVMVVVLDQGTKLAVVRNLDLCERIAVWGSLVKLTHIRNSGAVFGMMKGAGAYFTFFSILAAGVLLIVLFFSRNSSRLVKVALGLVLGGEVGNLIDRLRYGAVVDFIDLGVSERIRWPCFNLADFAITAGVILLIVNILATSKGQVADEGT
jgi:signal peptidase II